MTRPLQFRPVAQSEFQAAAAWYEGQMAGLGNAFVAEVERTLNSIAYQPERYPIADGDLREALLSRFPYCVYYRVKPDRIVVIGVFHSSRDPSIWKGRK